MRATARPVTASMARAAGAVGVLSNLLLIAFYAWQAGRPERGTWLGSANDLVGSVGSALMAVVALGLGTLLPRRRAARAVNLTGFAAMVLLTLLGPLLVAGVIPFQVQSPIALACFVVLAGWLLAVNGWLRREALLPARVTRLGEWSGGGVLIGVALAGPAFALPAASVPQLVLFAAGGLLGVAGMLAVPIWFVMLGRELPKTPVRPL